MKLIIELIEFALRRNLLTEENKRKLQEYGFYTFYEDNDDEYGFYTFYEDNDDEYQRDSEDIREEELDRTYYDDIYAAGKRSGKRQHGKRKSRPVGPELTVEELNQRVQEEWKKLTEEFPRLQTIWDSWKAGKFMRVFTEGVTLNDVYALTKVERRDYHEFSGPAPAAYRQLLRQVGNVMGKYSWVIKSQEAAAMVEFPIFQQQILEEVRAIYETDRELFGVLSSQNGKLNFALWNNAFQTDTTSMKVWTILNLSSKPVTPERIEEVQTWKPELAIAMQLDLDYMTKLLAKLEQRDWSSFMVITERKIENTILKRVVIPKGVKAIGDEAFNNCSSLTSVAIPEGVKAIGYRAFDGCSSLTSVAIPKGVTTIGHEAFRDCSSLTSVVIPEGVKVIGRETFRGCSSLTSVIIPEGMKKIESCAFCDCAGPGKAILSESGRILLNVYHHISGFFVIPESVRVIAPNAFCQCRFLKSVIIPESVKAIGDEAFNNCSSLTSVAIPEGVTTIGYKAFRYCSSLTSVVIPEGVKEIGVGAFDGCSSLTSVTIPNSVEKIGAYAFRDCSSLKSVVIPEGMKIIGANAFEGCRSLTSVTIPEGVTTIGYRAFYDCPNLTIHALAGSYAEEYANKNNIPFQPLEEDK